MLPKTCPLGKLGLLESHRGLDRPIISPSVKSLRNAMRPMTTPMTAKARAYRFIPRSQRKPMPSIPRTRAGQLLVNQETASKNPVNPGMPHPVIQSSAVWSCEGSGLS